MHSVSPKASNLDEIHWPLTVVPIFAIVFAIGYFIALKVLRIELTVLVPYLIFIPAYTFAYFLTLSAAYGCPWPARIIIPPVSAILAAALIIAIPVIIVGGLAGFLRGVFGDSGLLFSVFALLMLPAPVIGASAFGCSLWAIQWLLFGCPRQVRWQWLFTHVGGAAIAQVIALGVSFIFNLFAIEHGIANGLPQNPWSPFALAYLVAMAFAPIPHSFFSAQMMSRSSVEWSGQSAKTMSVTRLTLLSAPVIALAAYFGTPILLRAYSERPPTFVREQFGEYHLANRVYYIPNDWIASVEWRRSARSYAYVRFKVPTADQTRLESATANSVQVVRLEDSRLAKPEFLRTRQPKPIDVTCNKDFIPAVVVCWPKKEYRAGGQDENFWNKPADATQELTVALPKIEFRGRELILLDKLYRFVGLLNLGYADPRAMFVDGDVEVTLYLDVRHPELLGTTVLQAISQIRELHGKE